MEQTCRKNILKHFLTPQEVENHVPTFDFTTFLVGNGNIGSLVFRGRHAGNEDYCAC